MKRMYGRKGFTEKPEVRAILAQYEEGQHSSGGLVFYDAVPAQVAQKLLALLPKKQANDRQNDAPSFSQFVNMGVEHIRVFFHGYRVLPSREDERITVEGFYAPVAVAELMLSQCEHKPDEYGEIKHPKLGTVMRAWWD